jgi:hypothetical protein
MGNELTQTFAPLFSEARASNVSWLPRPFRERGYPQTGE